MYLSICAAAIVTILIRMMKSLKNSSPIPRFHRTPQLRHEYCSLGLGKAWMVWNVPICNNLQTWEFASEDAFFWFWHHSLADSRGQHIALNIVRNFPKSKGNGHKETLNMDTNYNILHFRCLMETQSLSNSLRCQEFHKAPKIPARAQILYSKQHKSTWNHDLLHMFLIGKALSPSQDMCNYVSLSSFECNNFIYSSIEPESTSGQIYSWNGI